MRLLICALAVSAVAFADVIGGSAELNPVRTHPHADPQSAIHRVIVKLRAVSAATALSSKLQTRPAQDRFASLAARAGLTKIAARSITADMQAMQIEPALPGETVQQTLARLRADPEVEYAEADQRRYVHAVPNDALYATQQWYMQSAVATPSAVDAEGAWDTTTGSTGLVIADLDTGVRFDHPDLLWAGPGSGGRVLPGYDFISDPFIANDGDGWDADPTDPGDWVTSADLKQPECTNTKASDSSWHGTRTAGILGALTNNGAGVAGMTWSGWILPVRVLGKCGGLDSDIITGMLWAAGVHIVGAPDNPYPARILNMSLGGTGSCPAQYVDVVNQLTAMGVLVVASAGNEGGPVDAPANCRGVAGVAGLRHAGTKVGFSSLGPELSLGAPAGNCVNTAPGAACLYSIGTSTNFGTMAPGQNGYTDQFANANLGTSFSAPVVSGIAGLMLAVNGNLGSAQLISRLKEGSLHYPQTSAGEMPQPPACHVPSGSSTDVQNAECICTLDGKTCGAGMANTPGALAAALRPIAAVKVPGNVAPGLTVSLDASGSGAACGHTVSTYQWVSSDPTHHPVSSATGATTTVTAPASGSFTITLTVNDDAGKSDSTTIVVSSTSAMTSAPSSAGESACLKAISVASPITVSVQPATATVQGGSGTQSFAATVVHTLNTSVTWQVNGVSGGNATVGTISTSGLYTAPAAGPLPARVTVSAVSAANPSRSGTAQVTIPGAVTVNATGTGGKGGGGAFDVMTLLLLSASLLAAARRPRAVRGALLRHSRERK